MADPQTPSRQSRLKGYFRVEPDGCWSWIGRIDHQGYGHTSGLSEQRAHRAIWTELRGPIPAGFHLHHICKNRACVNPAHLRPVTPGEHTLEHKLTEKTGLTIEDVKAIRELSADPTITAAEVARRYGVHEITVYEWWSGAHWQEHLGEPAPRPVRQCLRCGAEFSQKRRNAKFCSDNCRGLYHAKRYVRERRGLDPDDTADLRFGHKWREEAERVAS